MIRVKNMKKMWRANSLEKTLMLRKTEGKRRRGQQRMRWLVSITDSMAMNLSKLREIVKDRGAWWATVPAVAKSPTWLSNWTTVEATVRHDSWGKGPNGDWNCDFRNRNLWAQQRALSCQNGDLKIWSLYSVNKQVDSCSWLYATSVTIIFISSSDLYCRPPIHMFS